MTSHQPESDPQLVSLSHMGMAGSSAREQGDSGITGASGCLPADVGDAAPVLPTGTPAGSAMAVPFWRRPFSIRPSAGLLQRYGMPAVEAVVLLLWALLVAGPYLNMDPNVVPGGREFLSAVQSHHIWTNARACGLCALWNGGVRGGAPAFVDPYGSMLHPLVILTTLGWGTINGTKIALVVTLFLGGIAQLWLGYVLGVGRIARLWSAGMAVTAGHLAGRMDIGTAGLVLSTMACTLVLPPLIALFQSGSRRQAVLLGIMLAMAVVAGQGYMQVALMVGLPGLLLLVPHDWQQRKVLLRRLLFAGGLAVLLAAPFLVPFIHFLPSFGKDIDPFFRSGQPLAYVPLNLLIDDPDFYRSEVLQKLPYPYLYVNFVGWVAVGLAVWGVLGSRMSREPRVAVALLVMALLVFWFASGQPFVWIAALAPRRIDDMLASIRFYPVMAGLAVPPILALAALGLDRLLTRPWPRLHLALSSDTSADATTRVDLRWLLLVPLVLSLISGRAFAHHWITTIRLDPVVGTVLDALDTPDMRWVSTPFGEHVFVLPAVERGLKLANGVRPWHWQERPLPEPQLVAGRDGVPPGMTVETTVLDVTIAAADGASAYAAVVHADGVTACRASGRGGHIDVTCDVPRSGMLVIQENSHPSWHARLDGRPVALQPGDWLSVPVPAGKHTVALRYRPWDVGAGVLLCLIGVGVAGWTWRKGATLL